MRSALRTGIVLALAVGAVAWVARAAWRPDLPMALPIVVSSAFEEVVDTLAPRETLSDLLGRHGLTPGDVEAILHAAPRLDPRRLPDGLMVALRIPLGARPDRLAMRLNWDERLHLRRDTTGWRAEVETIEWRAEPVRIVGRVGSSLWESAAEAMHQASLDAEARELHAFVATLIGVYEWVVDFYLDLREGDRFDVIAERLISSEGERRFGRILAAELEVNGQPHMALALERADGITEYYDEGGRSLRRAFYRSPLEFGRLSSSFGMRRHPILGRWRNHLGVDYAARPGTPVRATADGVVTFVGRDGGYGNAVRIRHANRYSTTYAHLSRFSVRRGQRVRQGQVIGRVGATGLANGPHVHYELRRGGLALNSRRVSLGDGKPVAEGRRGEFERTRDHYLRIFASAPVRLARAPADRE